MVVEKKEGDEEEESKGKKVLEISFFLKKMKINIIKQDKKQNKISFILENTTPAFANLIRRTIIGDVPSIAIEDVEFKYNDSILYDEMVALRLGLIPLTTDLKTYNFPEDCKCKGKGCARCSVILSLKVKGPKTVYASDLTSKDPKIKPVFPETPIVKLLKGQKLEIIATAVLGKGKNHIKWGSGTAFYQYKPIIEVKNCANEKVAEVCPKKVFQFKNNKIVINKDKLLDCHLCGACTDECQDGSIKVKGDKNNLLFSVESWGQLPIKEMLTKASEIIDNRLDKLGDKLKKAK